LSQFTSLINHKFIQLASKHLVLTLKLVKQ